MCATTKFYIPEGYSRRSAIRRTLPPNPHVDGTAGAFTVPFQQFRRRANGRQASAQWHQNKPRGAADD